MEKMKRFIFLFFMGVIFPAYAENVSHINGNAHLIQMTYECLKINGDLHFEGLTIKNWIKTNGHTHGKDLICNTIISNGIVEIDGLKAEKVDSNGSFFGKNIDIKRDGKFNGDLEIKNGQLQNIDITSIQPTLIDTQVNGNIQIKKINSDWNFFNLKKNTSLNQILELKGNTLITGDIIFEKQGEIHLFDTAHIKGNIINADVIRKQ